MQVVVRNLTKRFDGVVAADDVSFEIPQGSFLTLLGPSGSGKTTTLMMMAGFVEPDSGTIEVAGRDITRLPPNKRELGVVFQSYALFPHKTVYENVAYPLEIRRLPAPEVQRRVARMLELVQLEAFAQRSVRILSGGQRQRVALARSLVFEPPVLLMDEPLGALDKKLREYMQFEIKNLQNSLGVTAVNVTHDQAEALTMSDVIAIMNEGKIVQMGAPTELYDKPANRFVAEFLGGVNLFRVHEYSSEHGSYMALLGSGVRVPCHAPAGQPERGAEWLGIRPERVRLVKRTAESKLFTATAVRQTYMGDSMLYELRSNDGLAFTAKVPVEDGADLPPVGAEVGISWTASRAWLLS